MKEELKEVSKAFTQKTVDVTVQIVARGPIRKMMAKFGLISDVRTFKLGSLCLGARMRISEEILEIPEFSDAGLMTTNHEIAKNHTYRIGKIIAMAIQNDMSDPSPRLIRFLLKNMDPDDLMRFSLLVLQLLNVKTFMTSIVSLRGASLLSPEIIAGSQKQTDRSTPGR